MTTRAESAAATRRSLLEAAGVLLDGGGVEAVTLREVGARSGVSRSAAYRHFVDKESLLGVLATNALNELGDALEELVAGDGPPADALRTALLSLIGIGRDRPHLYRLMFSMPKGDPAAAAQAGQRAQRLFLDLVGRITGAERARRYGALLLGQRPRHCGPGSQWAYGPGQVAHRRRRTGRYDDRVAAPRGVAARHANTTYCVPAACRTPGVVFGVQGKTAQSSW